MSDFHDFYLILGLPKTASQEEIKTQYLRLVKELHPDRHNGDQEREDRLKMVNAANQILSDEQRRSQYDQHWEIMVGRHRFRSLAAIRNRSPRTSYPAAPRTQVTSTVFKSIGYEPQSMVLEVEFRSGAIFQYMDVPDFVHAEFMSTDKKGSFYRERIISVYRERCVK